MRAWLAPWIIPIALIIGVLGGVAASSTGVQGGAIIYFLLIVAFVGVLVRVRLRHLKANPPDPELQHKPFWRF
ncbi:MAG TPA: hypothetical protein VFP55_11665 [Solirubrobacteraceae bacterium]|nr:hypothetical protein [Solirubrobacteraceae bacterium]